MAMVSVLLSTYNETLEEVKASVESMLAQSYQDVEIIIVLDNPENEKVNEWLYGMAEKYARVKCITHDINQGLVNSLNDAFAVSKGEYIARMDADDISLPDRIENQVQYMKNHPQCAILGTNRIDIDEGGNVLSKPHRIVTMNEAIQRILPYGGAFTHPTIMIRREVLECLGGYRAIPAAEDYDLYLRAKASGYEMFNLAEPLLYYRIRQAGISKSNPYKALCGAHHALKCVRKGKLLPFTCDYQKKTHVENYQEYLTAIKEHRILVIIICIIRDRRLLYEFYRNLRFQWILKCDGE